MNPSAGLTSGLVSVLGSNVPSAPLPDLLGRGLDAGVAFLTAALSIVPFDQRVLTIVNAPFESFHLRASRDFTLH